MINPNTLKPFGKFCVTLGMLPSSYKASLTYEEQLLWFCDYLENKVIPAVNNNAEALEEVQALYEEIRQFVVDYFSTLDVQDEIDNKLDEMAESGTLAEIINQQIFDDLNTQIGELDTRVDNLETSNATKISSVFGCAPSLENQTWNQYYVDNNLGNDENEGSQTSPFKTFAPLVNLINKGKLKIEVAFKRNQVHVLPVSTFNACTLHLSTYGEDTENAILTINEQPSTSSHLIFYNCHVNASNITFRNIGYDMYADGGSFVATSCTFDCKFTSWSAGIRFNNCIIKSLKLRMANAWIHGAETQLGCLDSEASIIELFRVTFHPEFNINHEASNACYVVTGGSIALYGPTSVYTDLQPAFNRFLYFTCLSLMLSAAPNATLEGSNFTNESVIDCSKIVATLARFNALTASCNGIQFTGGSEYPTE